MQFFPTNRLLLRDLQVQETKLVADFEGTQTLYRTITEIYFQASEDIYHFIASEMLKKKKIFFGPSGLSLVRSKFLKMSYNSFLLKAL